MAKADFDEIYTSPDPRRYYSTLSEHDYQIPAHSGAVFGQLADAFAAGPNSRVVDLCCSYGVNATVLKHDLEFDEIIRHYCDPPVDDLESAELLALDQEWYATHRRVDPTRVSGVDSSAPAISYATAAGILDAGFAEDLEGSDPSPALARELRDADLITVSGGIGYITDRTIDRVLRCARSPRLAVLCLRWVDFAPIVDAGAAHGLVTERLDEATFPQRRFADTEERLYVQHELDRLGVGQKGREEDGYHHTDLYLLRPEQEVLARPLDALIEPAGAIDDAGNRWSKTDEVDVSVFTSGQGLR
ncbi:MAG TPA: hypothetical protein VMN58_02880 [Acidimicrobiales bacterium]|nr:hypothetical protein [Acidimicrobiales bacterium]